jgi:hypothetical protein
MRVLSRILLASAACLALVAVLAWLLPAEERTALITALPALQGKVMAPEAAGYGEETEAESLSRVEIIEGAPTVRLTPEEQRYSGVRTVRLERVISRPEIQAYAEVVDIRPLIRLRGQYLEAQVQQAVAQARLDVSAQEYERLRGLNEQSNVISASRMRAAQSRWQVDQARVVAAQTQAANIRAQALQNWGAELSSSAFDAQSDLMTRLVNREDVLLRVTLAPGQSLAGDRPAMIERDGERRRARQANFISPAPVTSSSAQGETYFFRIAAAGLRTGMRVTAWLPDDKAPATGLLVPSAAGVWYGGELWAYVRVDDDLFVRRAVPHDDRIAGGWLASRDFSLGEPVVVSGGQMLLSEEFRWQIPEEDDD